MQKTAWIACIIYIKCRMNWWNKNKKAKLSSLYMTIRLVCLCVYGVETSELSGLVCAFFAAIFMCSTVYLAWPLFIHLIPLLRVSRCMLHVHVLCFWNLVRIFYFYFAIFVAATEEKSFCDRRIVVYKINSARIPSR